jgi:hypothetical protein
MERGNRSMRWFGIGPRARGQKKDTTGRPTRQQTAVLEPAVVTEVAQALKIKRWEERSEGEFRGFGSQPGRF